MSRCLPIACLLTVAAAGGPAAGRTYVSGPIIGDTQWTAVGGPYVVTSSVEVTAGARLTIDPGVSVLFESGTQLEVVSGELIARSGPSNPIRFRGDNDASWRGLVFGGGARSARFDAAGTYLDGSILEYATIEGCGYTHTQRAVEISGSRPFIHECTIRDNEDGGIRADTAPGIRIAGNDIHGNAAAHYGGGIHLVDSPGAVVSGNELRSNHAADAGGGIWLSNCADSQILGNRVIENTAYDAAGLWVEKSDRADIHENLCLRNVATRRTGGVHVGYCDEVCFAGNVIYDNDGGSECGGVRVKYGTGTTFEGDAILQNRALLQGGGIEVVGAMGVVLSTDPDRPTRIQGNSSPKGIDLHVANWFDGAYDLSSPSNVDARHVNWGTTEPATINLRICDYYDEPSKAVAVWDPAAEPPLKGDVNDDGVVNIFDAFLFNVAWGGRIGGADYDLRADFNIDGMINLFDAYALTDNWGADSGSLLAAPAVPEPVSGLLMLTGVPTLLAARERRRRRPREEARQ